MKNLLQPKNIVPQSTSQQQSTLPNELKAKQLVKNIVKSISQYTAQLQRLKNGCFHGKIINSMISGEGTFLFDSGEFYYGNILIANTTKKITTTNILIGQFCRSKPHGFGIFILQNGSILKGQFVDGMLNGFGQIEFVNRDIVRGFFESGEFVGERVKYNHKVNQWTFKRYGEKLQQHQVVNSEEKLKQTIDDPFYLDSLLAEKLVGYKLNRQDQSITAGSKELGCFIICRKDFFNIQIGTFNSNMRLEKKGKVFFQNGDIYDGNFKDQMFHGQGVYFNGKDNNWIIGIFDENQIKQVVQNSSSYPPPSYCNVFKGSEDEKVDYSIVIDNNVISNKLLLKCILGKNNQLYQNILNFNQVQIVVPSSKTTEPESIVTSTVQTEQKQIQSSYVKLEPQVKQRSSTHQLASNNKENDQIIKIQSLFNSTNNSTVQSLKENIEGKKYSTNPNSNKSEEYKNINSLGSYQLNLLTHFKKQYEQLDEIIEDKDSKQKLQTEPDKQLSQNERKYCLKQRQQSQSVTQPNIVQTFLKLDQPEYKLNNKVGNTQISPKKQQQSSSSEDQQVRVHQTEPTKKQIDQQVQIKVIENSISKSIQNIKPISQLQKITSLQVSYQQKTPTVDFSSIQQYQVKQQREGNKEGLSQTALENKRDESRKLNQQNEQRDDRQASRQNSNIVLKTEGNAPAARDIRQQKNNNRLQQNSLEKQNSLKIHMRNHSETIKNMLQARDSSTNSRSSSLYKSPLMNPSDKDFLSLNGVQEIILSNHTHLFTRTNSITNIKQMNEISTKKERSTSNLSQVNNGQTQNQKLLKQQPENKEIGNKNSSQADNTRLNRATSYLLLRQNTIQSNKSAIPPYTSSAACTSVQNKVVPKETTLSAKLLNKSQNAINIYQKQKRIQNPSTHSILNSTQFNKIIYK